VEVVEILALLPAADLGFEIAERPDEAQVLIVTGGANLKSKAELLKAYAALREPRLVVAVGSCAASMGIFKGGYSMTGPIDSIIPIDLYIVGCPPRPQVILGALAEALQLKVDGLEALLRTPEGFRGDPHVDHETCIGCSACANVCPADAIEIVDGESQRVVRFMRQSCVFCGTCQDVCPTKAVELRPGDPSWYRDKGASKSEAILPLTRCSICGARFIPEAQVEWALKRVDERRTLDQADRLALQQSLNICMSCRRSRIPDVREAKRLLTSLERKASVVP
jgi:Ni,Fe-hydrogenase III small subunit/formate hydrogenlyase subunit 6/NADH:ubiquinone oxidoreductase subunit I